MSTQEPKDPPAQEGPAAALAQVLRVRDIAQTGLAYTDDPFCRERYEELIELSRSLAGGFLDLPAEALLGQFVADTGYPTPKVEVRAGVFRKGQVLLVQEAGDQRWALPGGWCDQPLSPGTNAVKEVLEETGLQVRAEKLAAIRDQSVQTYRPKRLEHVYKLLFLCSDGEGELRGSLETMAAAFHPVDELPPLSTGRTIAEDILCLAQHRVDPGLATQFN